MWIYVFIILLLSTLWCHCKWLFLNNASIISLTKTFLLDSTLTLFVFTLSYVKSVLFHILNSSQPYVTHVRKLLTQEFIVSLNNFKTMDLGSTHAAFMIIAWDAKKENILFVKITISCKQDNYRIKERNKIYWNNSVKDTD